MTESRLQSLVSPRVFALALLSLECAVPTPIRDATEGAKMVPKLWDLAKSKPQGHRFSTLITAQDVRDRLSTDPGIDAAIDWCKKTGVTKVYLEVFRDGYQAQRAVIEHARERFLAAGFVVSGCVTTTQVGKPSTVWKECISCFTDQVTQANLQGIFEYAASLFDEIMIDDFWFVDCACPECDAARRARTVTIGKHTYSVAGDAWEDYRCELMVRMSRDRVLGPARRVNSKVRLIIKYPDWYDKFHELGYEVRRETVDFDTIWVGTETRDYRDGKGGAPPYEGYFIMRWLGGIGGTKCGGGWFDCIGTTERTYVEQARQTVLAGARESLLFAYGGLQRDTGPKDVEALRANVAELLDVAEQVQHRKILGIAAYKPANSHPENEAYIFDFVGMLGLPLAPCHEFPADAPAAFFSVHALKDANLAVRLSAFIAAGKPVLVTDGLARRLAGQVDLAGPNVRVLAVKGNPKSLLDLPESELNPLRAPLLRALKTSLLAPNLVAIYLFRDGSWVVENFNDEPATVSMNGERLTVAARGWICRWN